MAWAGSQFDDRQAMVQYSFTKYLPDFFVRYLYEEDKWEPSSGVNRLAYNQEVSAGFRMPIWRWRRWDASVGLALTYENNDAYNDPTSPVTLPGKEKTYGTMSTFGLSYAVAPSLGFLPWRGFQLNYVNRLETEVNDWTKKYNTSLVQAQYTHGFPMEFYGSLSANYAWAEEPDIKVSYDQASLSQDIRIPRLTSHKEEYLVKNAGSIRLEITNVRTIPAYSARIPFGLSRIAPVVVGQGIFLDDDPANLYPPNTFEWGWGADFELLFLHRVPLRLRILNAYDTRSPIDRGNTDAKLTYKTTF